MLRFIPSVSRRLLASTTRTALSATSQLTRQIARTSATNAAQSPAVSQGKEVAAFLGAKCHYTNDLKFEENWPTIDCFRRMDNMGKLIDPNYKIKFDHATLIKMYQTMATLNVMDQIFYDAQRQGRISFYMTNYGEEATHIGSASALDPNDMIYGQYREAGVLMWRGFTLEQFANQCFSNIMDLGKGRQMPVHYGSRELRFQTISSPLSTQIPQAAGAAYALKREKSGNIVMCYFGDGAASEGDFHVALNMSATLSCPVIFFCRNNGYAISTPTHEQYRGDGIAARGRGYGIRTIRVDGNDILAVHDATAAAREYAVANNAPVLIEAMTYRGGHHSTSDDSSRYRDIEEIQHWADNNNPVNRFRLLLENLGIWDVDQEANVRQQARKDVLAELGKAERLKKPPVSQLFTDVYDTVPPHLQYQSQQLAEHLAEYGSQYNLSEFGGDSEYEDPSLSHNTNTASQ